MSIVTATRIEASVQADGRLSVRELHEADAGESEVRSYLADAEADLDAMLVENSRLFLGRLATVERKAASPAAEGATLMLLPVGSLFFSVLNASPSALLGYGTWDAIAAGRMLVGVDPADADFDAAGKTGGEKTHVLSTTEMPSHTHVQDAHSHATVSDGGTVATNGAGNAMATVNQSGATGSFVSGSATAVNQGAGGGQAHNNLPPYFACYIWKRTA
jgi:hypothetical protein